MPRSPFQGTWQSGARPTVVHSPDALVFINGETDILGCGVCRRRFDWNKYITSVSVDLNVDSPPGSASISLSLPRHSVDEFYTDGEPLITPMMEVEIYAKGYYLVEGLPQYYPIFWGLVTELSDLYSGGEHTFSINCADILKWWEICMMNINPAYTAAAGKTRGSGAFGNILFGQNPYDVIWAMAQQSFGDIVVGSGSLIQLYKEGEQRTTFNAALSDIMGYWEHRFSKIRSNLLLYGTAGNVVRGDGLVQMYLNDEKNRNNKHFASQAVRAANGGDDGAQIIYDPTDPAVVAFRTQFSEAGQVNFWQSEYQTKLEVANSAKEAIGYEFYMDVTGDIVFKPPFYNLDILSNKPVSWIQDIDVIDWDLSESEAEVVTQIQIQGSYAGNVEMGLGEETTPYTTVTDYHLLRKYGWRTQTLNSEFLGSPLLMFYTGLDMLDRYNARRHRATVSIPCRPELRLGFPIYLAPKDQIWYIQGISHNIQFGGRAQTALTLTAKRTKFIAPKGIGSIDLTGWGKSGSDVAKPLSSQDSGPTTRELQRSGVFTVDVGDAAQLPPTNAPDGPDENSPYAPLILRHPKTGRIVGHPNVVLGYTRPFQPTPDELKRVAGRRKTGANRGVKRIRDEINKQAEDISLRLLERYTHDKEAQVWEKHNVNRYTYGLNSAGVYTYLHDKSWNNAGVIKDVIIMPAANIKVINSKQIFTGKSGMIRPVSDERGFEVIGHFKYGRGVSLRDGSLVLTEKGVNTKANIGTQMALAGDLYATIKAQSSGLATISTTAPNPIKAVVELRPEDLQTAGVINPETKTPAFVNTEPNFVDVAPLGSPEQKGVQPQGIGNVEASQLSHALTLAEMGVKESIEAYGDCTCLIGRPDLNFINTGFQLKTIRATPGDNTTITYGAVGQALFLDGRSDPGVNDQRIQDIEAKIAPLETELAGLQDELADIQAEQEVLGGTGGAAEDTINYRLAELELEKETQITATAQKIRSLRGDQAQLREDAEQEQEAEQITDLDDDYVAELTDDQEKLLAQSIQEGTPIAGGLAMTRDALTSKVESFLSTLYSALDAPHQEYEQALRGEILSRRNPTATSPDMARFGTSQDNNFEPPHGQMDRARGGDPAAIALEATTAIEDIEQTWDKFGEDLSNQRKAGPIKLRIQAIEVEISNLELEFLLVPPPTASRTVEIQQQIAALRQEQAALQQELNELNA